MVAKRKEKAGSKASSAAVLQAESSGSTIAEASALGAVSGERAVELSDEEPSSDEDQINSEQLEALWKRVADREEYTTLLQRLQELDDETDELTTPAQRRQSEVLTLPISRGPRFNKHATEYRGKNLQELR